MATGSRDFTIDLRRLRVLRELDTHGTVAAAAGALHLTPSAVSQQLATLSRDVGAPLLERRGRGVRLTGAARLLLSHASVVQEQLERARADLAAWRGGTVGEVRVAGLSTGIAALVAPAVVRLRTERPGLDVRVVEAEPAEAFRRLDAGDADVVVAVDHEGAPMRTDPRYVRMDLLADRLDALLPAGHPLAGEDGVRLEELAGEPWIAADPRGACATITLAFCTAAGFRPDVRHHALEWDAVAALVAAGLGVALVPRLAQPLRPPGLVVRPLLGPPAARLLFAAARAGAQADPATGAVLGALNAVARERGGLAA